MIILKNPKKAFDVKKIEHTSRQPKTINAKLSFHLKKCLVLPTISLSQESANQQIFDKFLKDIISIASIV